MRVVNPSRNVLDITDNTTGSELRVYYRTPETDERVAYGNATMKRKGNKVFVLKNTLSLQIEYGKKLITGIRKGDFGMSVEGSDKPVPFSSEQGDPDYKENWKELMVQGASDVLAAIARTAMNSITVAADAAGGFVEVDSLDGPLGS